MGDVSEQVREIQLRILEDMKKRRDLLNKSIAKLEYKIDNPAPPLNIDFEAIKEEAHRDMEFLNHYEEKRKDRASE